MQCETQCSRPPDLKPALKASLPFVWITDPRNRAQISFLDFPSVFFSVRKNIFPKRKRFILCGKIFFFIEKGSQCDKLVFSLEIHHGKILFCCNNFLNFQCSNIFLRCSLLVFQFHSGSKAESLKRSETSRPSALRLCPLFRHTFDPSFTGKQVTHTRKIFSHSKSRKL